MSHKGESRSDQSTTHDQCSWFQGPAFEPTIPHQLPRKDRNRTFRDDWTEKEKVHTLPSQKSKGFVNIGISEIEKDFARRGFRHSAFSPTASPSTFSFRDLLLNLRSPISFLEKTVTEHSETTGQKKKKFIRFLLKKARVS